MNLYSGIPLKAVGMGRGKEVLCCGRPSQAAATPLGTQSCCLGAQSRNFHNWLSKKQPRKPKLPDLVLKKCTHTA